MCHQFEFANDCSMVVQLDKYVTDYTCIYIILMFLYILYLQFYFA